MGNEPAKPADEKLAMVIRERDELRDAVRDLMAYWPELDNIKEERLDEYEIIVYARPMLRLKELIGE